MQTRLHLQVAVMLLLILLLMRAASTNASTVVFQGFQYEWLRRILGFQTPHRLGSIAAYIQDGSSFVSRFTPGVDGDFAHPRLFYTVVGQQAPFSPLSGQWHYTAHDRGEQCDHPFAETIVQDRIIIAIPSALYGDLTDAAAVVLNGFNVSMKCDSACGVCNSDGAWVYSFNVSISNCSNGGGSLGCDISFGLGRGWTPTHGGGKSFNSCMTYHITIYWLAALFKPSAFTALLPDRVEKLGWLSDGVSTALRSFKTPSGAAPLFTGMTAFGWDLLETDGHADRGRYLESYHFSLTQPNMLGSEFTYNVSLGLSDPSLTTVPSRVRYHLSALTLLVPSNDSQAASLQATGTVCKDDPVTAFYCSKNGMNASLVDTVPLQL
jgi:hypothetical protein